MRVVKVVKGTADRTVQRLCLRVFGAFSGAALHRNNPNQRDARTHAGAALCVDGKQRPIVAEPSWCHGRIYAFCPFKEGVFTGHWGYHRVYVHVNACACDTRISTVEPCVRVTVSNTRSSDALGRRVSYLTTRLIVHVNSGSWKHT